MQMCTCCAISFSYSPTLSITHWHLGHACKPTLPSPLHEHVHMLTHLTALPTLIHCCISVCARMHMHAQGMTFPGVYPTWIWTKYPSGESVDLRTPGFMGQGYCAGQVQVSMEIPGGLPMLFPTHGLYILSLLDCVWLVYLLSSLVYNSIT